MTLMLNETSDHATGERCSWAVIGGGFAGLSASRDLVSGGQRVKLLESSRCVGGLAGAFETSGERLDRFYHHWFTSDREIMSLIRQLGLSEDITVNPTNTGIYFANKVFKLSTPLDLLKLTALPLVDRFRLGLLTLRARAVQDWLPLEEISAADWLRKLGGENVYRIIWEPLLKGKFGPYAEDVSAVWFWNKLKLRGGSRGSRGEERLVYLKGSFARLAEAMASDIQASGGEVLCDHMVETIDPLPDGGWRLSGPWGSICSDRVLVTTALPVIADMIASWAPSNYVNQLRAINYLANVCLVLRLDRPLSSTYWLNVNDTSFPFVGVIEHTNFENPASYGGDHVVYLSRYLPHTDRMYLMTENEVLNYALPHLVRMFPEFNTDWIRSFHVWRARWAQPVVEKNYSRLIPPCDGPRPGFHICSMAQIYPEDRGTNYAVREGSRVAKALLERYRC